MLPGVDNIGQVAFVVRDLDRAMATWAGLGIGPWRVYTFDPDRLSSMTLRGREQPQVIRIALCSVGPTTYELIESR
jgi:methylmalonyl-CoA/ethylmalonyl-CoA epimerase